ncbi:phosphatase PAP2 family protein [Anaeromyxobacter paludicola]|uniref:Phosphatidic acid phosphatase type 2/haloperoxidase domain-containing protein n=1 Tax=Anaeromyxobacter paludicola TaxID=2918171 RepID=A0ABM7X6R6_9BACT|nr:phosphatase PAP2 family protein [Anaeromyxobacter paludicola]BDG07526.1 hypothetical protein AMPC_06390 [Anaeromyxobacter paludicola]
MPPLYAHDPFLAIHQALQSRWLDLPMAALSLACLGLAVAGLGAGLFGLLERDWRRFAAVALPFFLALCAQGILVTLAKDLFHTPRPLAIYGPAQVRVGLEPLRALGFPSGHSASVAVLAAYGTAVYGRRLSWLWAFAFLGGLSRVYVGAHWALDVAAGWALGALLGLVAATLAARARPGGHLSWRRSSRSLDIRG